MEQALSLALEVFGLPAATAVAVSLAVTWAACKTKPAWWSSGLLVPLAVAVGFFSGYTMLPKTWAGFRPDASQPWTWLPYVGFIAAFIPAAFPPPSRSLVVWKFAMVPVALVAAVLLTPDWAVLGMGRRAQGCLLMAYLLAVGVPLQLLAAQSMHRSFGVLLAIVAALLAAAIGAMVSTRLAQVAAIAAGALSGSGLASFLRPKPTDDGLRGLVPIYSVLVGGTAWIACVEPEPPQLLLLLIPLLPLAAWVPLMLRAKS